MHLDLPKVYPITDTYLSGLSHAEQVQRLIDGGATLIQLRDKHAAPRDFYRDAAAALEIARAHHVRLIINDRLDLAMALKADGVHLGQADLPASAARRLLGNEAIIGFSTHNLDQIELATTMPVDYVAFGPIYPTSTKENPDPVTGLSLLTKLGAKIAPLPLVAIGGITFTNAKATLNAGANSLAIIAELVANPSAIAENMSRMLSLTASSRSNPGQR